MRCLAFLLIIPISLTTRADDDWNQFRGPHGDGTSTETGMPIEFGEDSPEILWKTPVPGRAWASPVIWGRQIWLSNAPELQQVSPQKPKIDPPLDMSVVCLDLENGELLNQQMLFQVDQPQITDGSASYASSTPYIEEGRIYLHYGAYGTACLDTRTFETIWKRNDLPCNHYRGPGSSPVVDGNLLYLTFDGYDYQYLIALNKFTGETVWKKDRGDWGISDGDAKKAYSTPIVIEINGRKQLVSTFAGGTVAYDPLDGSPIWTVKHGGMNAAARPLFGRGLVYINTADGPNPLIAVRPDGLGDITSKQVWRATKAVPKRGSQLLVDDAIYMVNDGGVAVCLNADTGKEIWAKRLPGEYWSSPIFADGLIYCLSQQGDVPVFKAAKKFELMAENKFDEGFLASPAVAHNSLILRSKGHVYRVARRQP